ncbi:Hypothetical predicted protein [Lecanosticta acicola]|uniref:Uncharacterized protein n=1 Tax=Lecanosticta acicola TaxID=111012 RepID=A0AAI9E8I9_9PEZI|nr:Hypothetical predicted protein [Lecanosticta acicola]
MHASSSLALLAVTALSASAAPAPQSSSAPPETLSVAIYSDQQCSVSGSAPGSLNATVCYPVPSGVGSLSVYAVPFEGGSIAVYPTEECVDGDAIASFSTYYVGCQKAGSQGKAVKYTRT